MMKNVNQEGSLCLEKKYGEIKGKKVVKCLNFFSIFSGHFLLFMKEGIHFFNSFSRSCSYVHGVHFFIF